MDILINMIGTIIILAFNAFLIHFMFNKFGTLNLDPQTLFIILIMNQFILSFIIVSIKPKCYSSMSNK